MRRAAGGGLGALDQALDGVGVFVEELDVKVDARYGIDAGLGDLVHWVLGQRLALFLLRGERRGEQEAEEDGSESAHEASLRRFYSKQRTWEQWAGISGAVRTMLA